MQCGVISCTDKPVYSLGEMAEVNARAIWRATTHAGTTFLCCEKCRHKFKPSDGISFELVEKDGDLF